MLLMNACYGFCESSIVSDLIVNRLDNMYLAHGDELHCRPMLKDIRLHNYTIIKPIVSTDDYQDPSLKVYTEKCPNLRLNRINGIAPNQLDYAMTLSEKEREEVGMVVYYTKDFRIYNIDLDNDPENGKEFVFYGAGGYLFWSEEFIDTAMFTVVDFSSCKTKDIFGSTTGQNAYTKEGIISYGGKYYIYYSSYYSLFIGEWVKTVDIKKRERMAHRYVCIFSVISENYLR